MDTSPYKRSTIALSCLQLFPPSIQDLLVSDPDFTKKYNLSTDVQISFRDIGISIERSQLYEKIRQMYLDNQAQLLLKDTFKREWWLEFIKEDKENVRRIFLSNGNRKHLLPDFSALSTNQRERLDSLNQTIKDINLPKHIANKWSEILTTRSLSDDEIDIFNTEIEKTPIYVENMICSELAKGTAVLSTLVPQSEQYYNSLVGEYQLSEDITLYAEKCAKEHINNLLSWRVYDGFMLSLFLSSHSSLSFLIKIDQLDSSQLIKAYKWLQTKGDRISQIGAIEIGLSILNNHPEIELYLQDIIEQIRNDNVDDDQSRFCLLSALIVFVEGELSRTKLLCNKPPFWRRLASIAQASMIERCLIKSNVKIDEFTKWAMPARGRLFFLQILSDIRLEPRWYPEFILPHQLKAEFIKRIVLAAKLNSAKIKTPILQELIMGIGQESLQSFMNASISSFLPGPLEGGFHLQVEPPPEILKIIEEQLNANIFHLDSFNTLANSALIFSLDSRHAILAAEALRKMKYRVKFVDKKDQLVFLLIGIATVAAITRSNELANELIILTRIYLHKFGHTISAESALQIGLIAAAANPDLSEWCNFVGNWLTELAFQPLQPEEIKKLHFNIIQLCHIVPELWQTCGRAEAALKSIMHT